MSTKRFGRPPLGNAAKRAMINVRVHPYLKEVAERVAKKLNEPLSGFVERALQRQLGIEPEAGVLAQTSVSMSLRRLDQGQAKNAMINVRVHPTLKTNAVKFAKRHRQPLTSFIEHAMRCELGVPAAATFEEASKVRHKVEAS